MLAILRTIPAVLFFTLLTSSPLFAAITVDKTPNDVYKQVQLLAEDVQILRSTHNITTAWPHVAKEQGDNEGYVFQKALEQCVTQLKATMKKAII